MHIEDIDHALPDPDTYDICINNFQREVFMKALKHTINTMPSGMWKPDERATAESMFDMLDPNGSVGPLCPKGVNLFVL